MNEEILRMIFFLSFTVPTHYLPFLPKKTISFFSTRRLKKCPVSTHHLKKYIKKQLLRHVIWKQRVTIYSHRSSQHAKVHRGQVFNIYLGHRFKGSPFIQYLTIQFSISSKNSFCIILVWHWRKDLMTTVEELQSTSTFSLFLLWASGRLVFRFYTTFFLTQAIK